MTGKDDTNDSDAVVVLSDDDYVDDWWNREPVDNYLYEDDIDVTPKAGDSHQTQADVPVQDVSSRKRCASQECNEECTSDVLSIKRRSISQQVISNRVNEESNDQEARQSSSQTSTNNQDPVAKQPESKPVKKGRKRAAPPSVLDEFFGVYCLISRSPNKYFKNRCYIGYTVDPNRRIRQHNAGKQFGGAGRTDHRGPWEMVCIIHGFPNSVSALRFEWAWQNPDKSRRLRGLSIRKKPKESAFQYRLRIACYMLNSDPWQRLALTFRWLLPACEIPFPKEKPPPRHMGLARGLVEKISTLVPQLPEGYKPIDKCAICNETIPKINELLRCGSGSCSAHFHMRCLAKWALGASNQFKSQLFPESGKCARCGTPFKWGDLIRDQRILLSIEQASKPVFANEDTTKAMVPIGKLMKI